MPVDLRVALQIFKVESSDAIDISWSPDDRYIAVWDSPLEHRLLVSNHPGFKPFDSSTKKKRMSG